MKIAGAAAAVALALAVSGTFRAASQEYVLAVDSDAPASFEIPFEVVHPGKVRVEAVWEGPRVLLFRVEGPDGALLDRRSGPSPQRAEIDADAAARGPGVQWKLLVRGLASRGDARGRIVVTVPDEPSVVKAREEALKPSPSPPPPPDPWTVRRTAPEGAEPRLAALFARVEVLRALVFPAGNEPSPDTCGWQAELARALAEWRDDLAAGKPVPPGPTLTYLARLAHAVRTVEGVRTSKNPFVAGPAPDESLRRRAWLMARREELLPVERELDLLGELLRGGHAPDLAVARWPGRFAACLTACERYFDERVVSPEAPPNRTLAEAQWDRFLAAGDALEALSAWAEEGSPSP